MEAVAKRRLTAQEYLALERRAGAKSEFVDGEMFALAGGTRRHSVIAANLIRDLGNGLRGKSCQVFTSDMRVKIESTGLFTYPDVMVACGSLRFEDPKEDTLLNPKVIIEVLSDSTVGWDRGQKFWHYRHSASLAEYVLVAQDGWLIEQYRLQPGGNWLLESSHEAKGVLALPSTKCKVPFADIYSKTGLKPGVLPPGPTSEPRRKR